MSANNCAKLQVVVSGKVYPRDAAVNSGQTQTPHRPLLCLDILFVCGECGWKR